MKRIILVYGLTAGGVVIGSMILGLALSDQAGAGASSELAGYLAMLVALTLIFLGIKRYRDRDLGGVIRFKTAFLVGLGISVVAGIIYVAAWEVNLSVTDYAFIEEYTASVLENRRAEGLSGAALEAEVERMEALKAQYGRLTYRLPVTFMEIFPVGLLITLISAAVLRNPNVLNTQ